MSKWNSDVIVKMIKPLYCRLCNNKRNRFLRNTLICALCARKLSDKQKREGVKKEMVKL